MLRLNYKIPNIKIDKPLYTIHYFINNTFYDISSDTKILDLSSKHITCIFCSSCIYLSLNTLIINDNKLRWFPPINSLEKLIVNNCELKELPIDLPNIVELNCSSNEITTIPYYKKLKKLDCSDNPIKYLPDIELTNLKCNNTLITSIPIYTLIYLEAKYCPINTIYDIKSLIKRSSSILDGKISYTYKRSEKINTNNIILNYQNKTLKLLVNSNLKKILYFQNIKLL